MFRSFITTHTLKSPNFIIFANQVQSIIGKRSAYTDYTQEIKVDHLSGNDKGITVVGINRPEAKNAFSKSLVSSLSNVIKDLQLNKEVRVVILRSLVKGVFCAGADLKERSTMSELEVKKFVNSLRKHFLAIEELPMPVIAAIDGIALGGGLEMALACDIRISAENVILGLVETRLAIIPGAGGTQRLPRILNPALAKELIYTSRTFNGKEAKEMGIVNHYVKQNEQNDAAFQKSLEIGREILPNGPIGVRMAKVAINKGIQVDIASGCAIEEECYAQVLPTKDRLEGLNAFKEKRKPNYVGE